MRKELAWLRRGAPARTSKPKFRIDAANQLIADVPPIRNTVELAKLATARLGKGRHRPAGCVGVLPNGKPDGAARGGVADRAGRADRIVGANGAGKSTLWATRGNRHPDSGPRVKRGKDGASGDAGSTRAVSWPGSGRSGARVLGRLKAGLSWSTAKLTPRNCWSAWGFAATSYRPGWPTLSGQPAAGCR